MEYTDLTDEQKKKLDACETAEDILALAQDEGVELTPEQIEMVSGGKSANQRIREMWKKNPPKLS